MDHLQIDYLLVDHLQIDHLDPILPLWDAVQDLYSTDPTDRKHVLDHAGYTAPTRQRKLQ